LKFIITIDTEGDNQWDPGLPASTENIRFLPRFQQLCDRFRFPPTYLCTYDVVESKHFDDVLRPVHSESRGEIGAHLHPWTTPPFSTWDRSEQGAAYPSELPPAVFAEKMRALTTLLASRVGKPPTSYRAGRWGLSAAHVPILIELGYRVDCSVTPYLDWRDRGARERGQDFSDAPVAPYVMGWSDPSRPGESGLLEVPVTIVCTNRVMRRSPLLRAAYRRYRKTWVARGLNRSFAIAPRWMRPFADMTVSRLQEVHRAAVEMELPVVEMMFHSSELMPEGSPHSPTAAAVEDIYRKLEALFEYLTQQGVTGATLSDFAATSNR